MKIKNRIDEFQRRKKIEKYQKLKKENQESNVIKTKSIKLYDYYKCDYCNEEIKLDEKECERNGGIVTLPQTLTKKRKSNTSFMQ